MGVPSGRGRLGLSREAGVGTGTWTGSGIRTGAQAMEGEVTKLKKLNL